jgi:HSP20 family protein
MARLLHRDAPGLLPDVLDWVDSPWTLLPFPPGPTFRVEDYADDGRYVVRAELPGLDPARDIQVTVDGDTLTIHAERREEHTDKRRSEFRYGSLTRSVRLPAQPDAKDVTARYDQGILEVSVPASQAKPGGRQIEIEHAG